MKVAGLEGVRIAQTACGRTHTLAISEDGKLYAWGANYEGALGSGGKTDQVAYHFLTSRYVMFFYVALRYVKLR
jgi:alpha-tubulin suppressor-like RCC1 family protein